MRNAAQATIWLANIAGLADATVDGWAAELGPAERLRDGAFVRQARRHQFVAGRRLLRRVLAASSGLPDSAILVEERAALAPLVTLGDGRRPTPYFSISHSGPFVACAVSVQSPLGLDIEMADPARDVEALARQAFSQDEAASVAAAGEQRSRRFYELWSRKEALYKLGAPAAGCVHLAHPALAICLCSALPLRDAPALQAIAL